MFGDDCLNWKNVLCFSVGTKQKDLEFFEHQAAHVVKGFISIYVYQYSYIFSSPERKAHKVSL